MQSSVTLTDTTHDLLVIGGGINGVGIAADAAGRGLDVVLCEKSDLANATSSASSKLIHGGLRYLEFYEFGLVRKSLQEREVLIKAAPHLIRPLAFQIPQLPHSRNSWMLRAGLFLYDNLATRNRFKGSRGIRFGNESPLQDSIKHGFEYWDGQVDDSRLVILNAIQARLRGAHILTRTECTALSTDRDGWRVTLLDHRRNEEKVISFKAVVNATGPWVSSFISRVDGGSANQQPHQLRLVKGSHFVVPKIHDGEQAFLLQHHDGRVVFVIPYLQNYSLIGTTEQEFEGDFDQVAISDDETAYLLSIVNLYFKKSISSADIIHSFAGVRPLIDVQGKDSRRVSRDYRLELDTQHHPLLSVYGGKVTTYRKLAEDAVDRLKPFFPSAAPAWTAKAALPGGDFDMQESLFQKLATEYAWLGQGLIKRWLQSYGTLSFGILQGARGLSELGVKFGHDLYQREVDYLCSNEWAQNAEDVLWRRSKLGYQFSEKERSSLDNYISQSFSITSNDSQPQPQAEPESPPPI